MPGIGHDGGITHRSIYGKELVGLMVGIGIANGYNNLACLDVEFAVKKLFVNPKLLNVYLAAFLYFSLVFTSLLSFYLHSRAIAAMLKLYLRPHRTTLAKIIADVHTDVGQVKASMALIVSIVLWFFVAVEALTVKIPAHDGLSITAYM